MTTYQKYRQNQSGSIVYFDDLVEALPDVPVYRLIEVEDYEENLVNFFDKNGEVFYEGDYFIIEGNLKPDNTGNMIPNPYLIQFNEELNDFMARDYMSAFRVKDLLTSSAVITLSGNCLLEDVR